MGKGGGGDLGFGACLASSIGEVDVCAWLFNIEQSKGESKHGCQGGPFGSGRLRWVSKFRVIRVIRVITGIDPLE